MNPSSKSFSTPAHSLAVFSMAKVGPSRAGRLQVSVSDCERENIEPKHFLKRVHFDYPSGFRRVAASFALELPAGDFYCRLYETNFLCGDSFGSVRAHGWRPGRGDGGTCETTGGQDRGFDRRPGSPAQTDREFVARTGRLARPAKQT